jgi:FtsP/CotA-like multicopper oxidase with cupredoxin domain
VRRRRRRGLAAAPDETINLKFQKIPGGRGHFNRWTINGKSWPHTNPLFTVEQGKRYRLVLTNDSGDMHPVHLHRHTFEVTKIGDTVTSGVMKDTLSMPRFTTAEVALTGRSICMSQDWVRREATGLTVQEKIAPSAGPLSAA